MSDRNSGERIVPQHIVMFEMGVNIIARQMTDPKGPDYHVIDNGNFYRQEVVEGRTITEPLHSYLADELLAGYVMVTAEFVSSRNMLMVVTARNLSEAARIRQQGMVKSVGPRLPEAHDLDWYMVEKRHQVDYNGDRYTLTEMENGKIYLEQFVKGRKERAVYVSDLELAKRDVLDLIQTRVKADRNRSLDEARWEDRDNHLFLEGPDGFSFHITDSDSGLDTFWELHRRDTVVRSKKVRDAAAAKLLTREWIEGYLRK